MAQMWDERWDGGGDEDGKNQKTCTQSATYIDYILQYSSAHHNSKHQNISTKKKSDKKTFLSNGEFLNVSSSVAVVSSLSPSAPKQERTPSPIYRNDHPHPHPHPHLHLLYEFCCRYARTAALMAWIEACLLAAYLRNRLRCTSR